MKKYIQSKLQSAVLRKTLFVVGVLIVVLVIFQAGMFVGERRAAFSYRFGDNYMRNFGEHTGDRGLMGGRGGGTFLESHGAAGKILSITPPTLIILGRDNIEKVILTSSKTAVKQFRDNATLTDLKIDDFIVVIGSPNEASQIDAKFIRILPTPPDFAINTSTSTN